MTLIQPSFFEDPMPSIWEIGGLRYVSSYINESEERALLRAVDAESWRHDLKRRVQHYGYHYDYSSKNLGEDSYLGNMPDWLLERCEILQQQGNFLQIPDQVIANEYMPGQGISSHIDKVELFGEYVGIMSLGSVCVMDFSHASSGEKHSIMLEPRSLLMLSGAARYEWKHSIPARKTDSYHGQKYTRARRVSLTFRNVKKSAS